MIVKGTTKTQKLFATFLFVLLVAFSAGFLFPPKAQAQPKNEVEIIYYQTAAKIVVVGGYINDCFAVYRWGEITPYRTVFSGESCNEPW